MKNKLSLLAISVAFAGSVSAVEFDAEGDNLLGYQGTDVTLQAGYYTMQNGAKDSDFALLNPTFDGIDDTFMAAIITENKFNWGMVDVRFGEGLKDGMNNDGHIFITNAFVNTPLKALKLYGGVEHQYFDGGRNEKHVRYGIGFGFPLAGQIVKGYVAKRESDIVFGGIQAIDGDNGYVLGLKANYEFFNNKLAWDFAAEYAWDKNFTSVPVPPQVPIYGISDKNLTSTSFKMVNKLTYKITESLGAGIEYLYMEGEAVLVEDAGLLGAFVSYKF